MCADCWKPAPVLGLRLMTGAGGRGFGWTTFLMGFFPISGTYVPDFATLVGLRLPFGEDAFLVCFYGESPECGFLVAVVEDGDNLVVLSEVVREAFDFEVASGGLRVVASDLFEEPFAFCAGLLVVVGVADLSAGFVVRGAADAYVVHETLQ